LASRVVATRAHLGLAKDGDADRFGLVDADGSFLEPNYFLGLLLSHLVKARGWTGGMARSVVNSHLVDAVARHANIPVFETPAGFKYIGELIAQGKVVLGGNESAGLSVKGHVPEKDGILACLLAADMVATHGCGRLMDLLRALYAEAGTIVTKRLNFHLPPGVGERLQAKLEDPPKRLADRAVIQVNRLNGGENDPGRWQLAPPLNLRYRADGPPLCRGLHGAADGCHRCRGPTAHRPWN